MGKTLLNNIAKGAEVSSLYSEPSRKYSPLRRTLMAIPAALSIGLGGLAGCKPYVIPEEAPVVSGSVTPTSGQVPLDLEVIVEATDVNDNVADYSAFADYNNNGKEDAGETIVPSQPVSINSTYIATTPGNYGIFGKSTDTAGNETVKKLADVSLAETPVPMDMVEISGDLQDNEDDINRAGEVRAYVDGVWTQTDTDGNDFYFVVPSGSSVVLRGKINDNGLESYVRTRDLGSVAQNTDVTLRAVPYVDLDNSGEVTEQEIINYRKHIELTNAMSEKFDITNLIEAEIMNTNRDGTGYFNELENMRINIKNSLAQWFKGSIGTDGELYIQERLIPVKIVSKEEAHYNDFSNRIVYEPYSDLGAGVLGQTSRYPTEGVGFALTKGALIRLLSNSSNSYTPSNFVRMHEEGHGTNTSVGEAYWRTDEMPSPNPEWIDPILSYRTSPSNPWNGATVMETGIIIPSTSTIGAVDLKVREIVLEDTFEEKEPLDNYLDYSF